MSLVNSLLTAIVQADGDAMVMQVGEKPYVVTTAGTLELSTSALNLETMSGMITQLLPADSVRALSDLGAVEHQLTPPEEFRDRFKVVVARGGDDIWIEIRRHRAAMPAAEASPVAPPEPAAVVERVVEPMPEPVEPPPGVEVPIAAAVAVVPPSAPAPVAAAAPVAPAEVAPVTRTLRIEVPPRVAPGRHADFARLFSIAAARGASALYLTSQSRPFLKVDGDVRPIENEAMLTSADVEAAVLELMPESAREAHSRGEPAEWVSEFEGIGHIRCATFRDYRGACALLHFSAPPSSAAELGLPREIQTLATEPDGLVLVASPRGSGKSTLVAALVDVINRHHSGTSSRSSGRFGLFMRTSNR